VKRSRRLRVGTILLALLLSGCAGSPPALEAETSSTMQDSVVAIAEAAAGGDLQGAAVQLDELEALLAEAQAEGTVSATRAQSIQTAIDVVRADLEAAVRTPEPTPEPTEDPTEDPDDDSDNSGPGNNNGKSGGKGEDKDD
jgi:starvation-inducible outer membrane lipoprotein